MPVAPAPPCLFMVWGVRRGFQVTKEQGSGLDFRKVIPGKNFSHFGKTSVGKLIEKRRLDADSGIGRRLESQG